MGHEIGAIQAKLAPRNKNTVLAYDPTSEALLQPELHETLLREGMSYSIVQLAAEFARLAYLRFDVNASDHMELTQTLKSVGYNELQCFVALDTDTQAFAAYNATANQVIVAFRGTQSTAPRDWLMDARFLMRPLRGAAQVHSGFDDAWRSVAGMLRRWLAVPLTRGARLCLCGHSLGAALATRAALELPCVSLITMGSPRVGNAAFAENVKSSVRELHRFVNCCDVVAHVPPSLLGYAHAGQTHYIDRHGMLINGEANTLSQERDSTLAREEWLTGFPPAPPGKSRMLLRDLADHAPINYLRALF
jgi:Lipase (class 3)